ncbi:hypothetical protein BDW74DRAFT_183833 [Aspergillus multicolor]|uniref:uncharacterized protein n=1 Tax=Aspergillus multicolor TaxID=41759 RepID=UPI003CCDE675
MAQADAMMPASTPDSDLSLPRRVLRRGTRSCAECKRRKTRCFFRLSTDAACVACQRRGISCIGQELMDVPLPNLNEVENIVERLKRAELMLETITKGSYHEGTGNQDTAQEDRSTSATPESDQQLPADVEQEIEPGQPLEYAYPQYAELCHVLHSHLPSHEDATTLCAAGRAVVFVQAICNHYGELFHNGDWRPIAGMADLPPVTQHPVIIARKLLQMALCIQQLDPSFDSAALNLGGDSPAVAMDTYFNVATSMVTCHEDLLDSIEGLECLIYEAVFLVNSGNLRRALVCLRRASTIAQFMGLHRAKPHLPLKQQDPHTRVSGPVTWAHIAYLERYICLILGMPTAISRVRFGSDKPTDGDTSADWFEKTQIDIFERIINRNQDCNFYYDLATTQAIDFDLNAAASSLPAKWWGPMDLTQPLTTKDMMEKMISAQMQIVHYNMLTVLHLPYLLRDSGGGSGDWEYSITTCIYASREVLNRFITFRSIVKLVTCCRPVDFCAFTAALTLLLSYLKAHKQAPAGRMLPHQRVGDRALIETAMETMDELNRLNNDELSRRTAHLVRRLLKIEEECACGGPTYNSTVEDSNRYDETAAGDAEQTSFTMKIPYFGIVKLARDKCTSTSNQYQGTLSSDHRAHPVQNPSHLHSSDPSMNHTSMLGSSHLTGTAQFDTDMPDLMASAEDWAFQGVDSAFFDAVYLGNRTNMDSQDEVQGGYMLSI